jgi:hypothetical protein
MRNLTIFALATFLVGASAVHPQDVRYDFDNSKDFSKYTTYKWVQIKGSDQVDELTANKVVAAVDAELTSKGLTRVANDSADLYIGFQTAIGSEKQFNSFSTGWGYGPGWDRNWYGYGGMGTSTTYGTTSTVYIGQLDLSMYDSAQKHLVWRGTASKTLDPKAKPDKKQKNIEKAVRKLLKNYPPPIK